VTYDMIDEYDEEHKITSMAKTTGYTAAIIARILGSGAVKKKGYSGPSGLSGASYSRNSSAASKRGRRDNRDNY